MIFIHQFRLGENTTTKDTLLLSERHEKDAIRKALTEAEEKNDELLMKVEDSNEKIEHLQNTINKFVPSLVLVDILSIFYLSMHPHNLAHENKKPNCVRE